MGAPSFFEDSDLLSNNTYTHEAVEMHTLANGMTVCMEALPYLHSASAGVWIRTGSGNERVEECGVAHFLEHLFFKGTKTRDVHQIMEAIESRGGQLNAFTSREYTCLYVKVLDKYTTTGIEILADLIKNSLFCDLEKERNVVLEEITAVEDTPDDLVHDLMAAHHWPGHALGRAIAGTIKSVSALDYERVVNFYQRWYTPENMVFSIAGNIDTEAVLKQVRDEFEAIPGGSTPAPFPAPTFNAGVKTVERDIAQSHMTLSFPGLALGDERKYVYDLTGNVLGGGSTSRLFMRIRENEGLAYSIYAYNAFYRSTGMLGVYAGVAPEQLGKALTLTFEELRKLRDDGVPEKELELNREQIKGGMLMALESTSTRMARMAKSVLYHGEIIPIATIIKRIDAVTCADVQDCARNTFVPEKCALLVLGPPAQTMSEEIAL